MLERAAGCLENAGRRFFRDSNEAIRSSGSIYPQIRSQYNGTGAECLQWLLIFQQTSDQRVSASNPSRPANDTRTPFLDFLYPNQTQEYAESCTTRSPKRVIPRRRRKLMSLTRSYTSEATSACQHSGIDNSHSHVLDGRDGEKDRKYASDSLMKLLEGRDRPDYGKAWSLYIDAGYPSELHRALLAYLSNSERFVDHTRAKDLFDGLPIRSRAAEDYLHLAKSYSAMDKPLQMKNLCEEAMSNGVGAHCWSFTFAYFVQNSQWTLMRDTWNLVPHSLQNVWLYNALLNFDASSLSQSLDSITIYLQNQKHDGFFREFACSLIQYAFSSLKLVEHISTESLLSLLRKFNDLGVLTRRHYLGLIGTLQCSTIRTIFIRSIVVYRNFRWQMEKEIPPAKCLGLFLRSMAAFEITYGVQYFLEEFTHFYGKPSIDAYKSALIAFSRAGHASQVNRTFEKLMDDHGKPLSRRLVTPLLHVHARAGDVQETLRQFNRISEEFGLEPNTVCWNNLLAAYAQADDLEGCLASFEDMQSKGVEPNAHTFGTLMGLCANRGDIDNVRRLLAIAKERQIQITAPLLDTIVEAYCNNGRFEMAENVAETCLGLEVKGSRVRMWNILLWNHAFRIDLMSVSRIRSRMDAVGLQPDGMTYGALMLTLVLIGRPDSARRILRTLHRSRRVYATEFHYAIILYGYVKSRNRDMVHIIFREIYERFKKPGFSSRLLVLQSQIQRDLQLINDGGESVTGANIRLNYAEKFLADTIGDFDSTKFATKDPQPGAGKQSIKQAFPAMYYERLITAYGARGESEKVQELFDQFIGGQQSLSASDISHDAAPLRMLSALMRTYLKADQHNKVDECWKMALPRAVKMASRPNFDKCLSPDLQAADFPEPPRPSPPLPIQGHKNLVISSESSQVSESDNETTILPSMRFILSRPLSLYLRSLAYRNESWRIPGVVAKFEQTGFSMSTFNWSTYVQMLASSERRADQKEAFTLFEQKFMPNFPGWKHLQRSYVFRPSDAPESTDLIEHPTRRKHPDVLGQDGRNLWRKVDPDFMAPTYISMVYLAAALARFRENSIYDGGHEINTLHSIAPNTIAAVADLPYLRDKFQGVLLRGREEWEDKRDGHDPVRRLNVWTGGVLGARGKRRPLTKKEPRPQDADSLSLDTKSAQEVESSGNKESDLDDGVSAEDFIVPPQPTLESQDEFDIETASLLKDENYPEPADAASEREGVMQRRFRYLIGGLVKETKSSVKKR